MKTKNSFTLKAILIAALFLIAPLTKAQNFVLNGNLETPDPNSGFGPCQKNGVWNNGYFYFGDFLLANWYGQNYGTNSSSGTIFHNNATACLGAFPSGQSAYSGDISGQVYLSYIGVDEEDNDIFSGDWVSAELSSSLGEGCYWVCIALNNQGEHATAGTVEIVLVSSSSSAETVIFRKEIPANTNITQNVWAKYKSYFKLTSSDAGIFDRIIIRTDKAYLKAHTYTDNGTTYHKNRVLFDDVSIATCTGDIGYAVADADFNYSVSMVPMGGEDAPVISATANANDDLYIHRWDILVSDDETLPESEWTHMTANSATVLEDGNFNSGTLEVATTTKFYKAYHAVVSPCTGWAIDGKLIEVKTDGTIVDHGATTFEGTVWSPGGDEFGAPSMQAAPSTPGDKAGEAELPMYEIWPNPPVDEITITPSKHNTNKTATVKCLVFDSKGATVIPPTDITENNTINISALPTGVYYMQINSGGKIEIQKFIK